MAISFIIPSICAKCNRPQNNQQKTNEFFKLCCSKTIRMQASEENKHKQSAPCTGRPLLRRSHPCTQKLHETSTGKRRFYRSGAH